MKSKKNSEWRTPHTCGECSEFDAGQRPTASGVEPAGWCVQCHGPVRPEAPACVLFERRGQSVKYRIEFELSGCMCDEEVVRCVDCKHGRSPQQGLPWMCIRNCCAHIPIEPDGFCAWGERRDA